MPITIIWASHPRKKAPFGTKENHKSIPRKTTSLNRYHRSAWSFSGGVTFRVIPPGGVVVLYKVELPYEIAGTKT